MKSNIHDIMKQTESLTTEEKFILLGYLIRQTKYSNNNEAKYTSLKSKDVCGLVPYPFFHEDAQQWISRTRKEDDSHREFLLKDKDENK